MEYELGEMRSESGAVLRYEVEKAASDLALSCFELVRARPSFRGLREKVGDSGVDLYFQRKIKSDIYPTVRDLCVLNWRKRNETDSVEDRVLLPDTGIYPLLKAACPVSEACFRPVANIPLRLRLDGAYRTLRKNGRRLVDDFRAARSKRKQGGIFSDSACRKARIAVQYVEGINLQRRSDLVWFPESGIDPSQILIYFEHPDHEPVDAEVVRSISDMGMNWVSLRAGSVEIPDCPIWSPNPGNRALSHEWDQRPGDTIDQWIHKTGKELIREVNYWSAFYDAFNIKIHFITGGSDTKYIAQGIAFDLNGSKKGFLAGKQRSELMWPPTCILGWYPVDVFFTWSPRVSNYLVPNVNQIITAVATGFSSDSAFRQKNSEAKGIRAILEQHGAKFVLAIFDNAHGRDMGYSTEMMRSFYTAFLSWIFEDPEIGIVIKSKKPSILQKLPDLLPLLAKAEETGRCIRLENEFGRLPVDGALAGDISVGIGISSAVIEGAIAGCRAVHCDLTHFRSHEFYSWGFEKILFDDLGRILSFLKEYKAGNADFSDLGDWTPFLEKLDPFRDGKAGERMGRYLHACLEGFDVGLNREEVLRKANGQYSATWGADKISSLPGFPEA